MGTSASGTGPKGKTPLLPSWANSPDSSPETEQDENGQEARGFLKCSTPDSNI